MFMNFVLRHISGADNYRPCSKTEKGQTGRYQDRKHTKHKQIILGKRYSNKHKEKRRESEAKKNTKHTKLMKNKRGKCNSKINRHRNEEIRARERKRTSKTEKGGGTEIDITLP